jgi:hypothetical protein
LDHEAHLNVIGIIVRDTQMRHVPLSKYPRRAAESAEFGAHSALLTYPPRANWTESDAAAIHKFCHPL